ncbi:MAG: glycosyltransferase [Candidatus Magasanikbacteria bacterium]|jgi:dolichol-phosphate mannosyltransferase|nr:glycosyltransferase [Candidatus Magasanikbacteria bacterium]MBT4314808.1 glycosyltransferase [Candidatus Magasanikbacteria bacterium]MBT4547585.1 glycosyltransferase [Candidatus Magasanikbacteria bacterium]MBT6818834.1 glycosyltransferase [Candidatus Magasanikbacteria bacterium]
MENKIIKLSVVLPAYQEAENLSVILPKIKDGLNQLNINYEIIVVDTLRAMDDTKDICLDNSVVYLNRDNGNNYGDAIRTGIKNATGEFFVFMDADGSHSPEFIKKLYSHRNDADVVIASRYVKGGNTENSKILILMSLAINILYSSILNLKCKDVSNSFKLYRSDQLKDLSLNCNNFDIVEEIMFKLKKKNKSIKFLELPYTFKKREFGKTKRNLFLFAITYVITILKLRFGK